MYRHFTVLSLAHFREVIHWLNCRSVARGGATMYAYRYISIVWVAKWKKTRALIPTSALESLLAVQRGKERRGNISAAERFECCRRSSHHSSSWGWHRRSRGQHQEVRAATLRKVNVFPCLKFHYHSLCVAVASELVNDYLLPWDQPLVCLFMLVK